MEQNVNTKEGVFMLRHYNIELILDYVNGLALLNTRIGHTHTYVSAHTYTIHTGLHKPFTSVEHVHAGVRLICRFADISG